MNIFVAVPVDTEFLAEELVRQLEYEDLIKLITDIDTLVADWEFTDRLIVCAEKWKEERKKEAESVGMD